MCRATRWAALMMSALLSMQATAKDVITIAGKEVAKQEKFEVMFENKLTNHLISFTQFRSQMRETRGEGLFNAVRKTCSATWNLSNGSGAVEGYCSSEKENDKFGARWNGMCNSAGGSSKHPVLRCGGGWIFVAGSGNGRFAGIDGGGTWSGEFLTSGDFELEWDGVYRKAPVGR
jgi:hypothetical protein